MFLNLLVTQEMMENIADETNRYHSQRMVNAKPKWKKPRRSLFCRVKKTCSISRPQRIVGVKKDNWIPVTAADIRMFLGMSIAMGILKLPRLEQYWSTSELFNAPDLAKLMPRQRFQNILWNLHLVDNTLSPKRSAKDFDKLFKVRGFLHNLQDNFHRYYSPFQKLCVDETMILFKGRSSLKQYMPKKPTKWGYKVWALVDCTTKYLVSFQVYEGKSEVDLSDLGLGGTVVKALVSPFEQQNHIIYCDNYFTSVALCNHLISTNSHCVGTTKSNRKGFPEEAKMEHKKNSTKQEMNKRIVVRTLEHQSCMIATTSESYHDASKAQLNGRRSSMITRGKTKLDTTTDFSQEQLTKEIPKTSKPKKGDMRFVKLEHGVAVGWFDKSKLHMLSTFHEPTTTEVLRKQKDGKKNCRKSQTLLPTTSLTWEQWIVLIKYVATTTLLESPNDHGYEYFGGD